MKYILTLLVLAAMSMPIMAEELSRKSFKQVASLDRDDFKPFRPDLPPKPVPEPEPEPEPEPAPTPAPVVIPHYPIVHYGQPVFRYTPVYLQPQMQPAPVFQGGFFPARGGFFRGSSGGVTCVGGG